ncbi:DUF402 domain-containing protein [Rhodococcus sp. D2-41]|uniref:DUF402 domain-containing protein n=1 Tax=Speluncibacter jeojiensis TaxID=2710754 RepID=A0A9X4RD07_9ACTN|nr:DUF402 domain-containing protein [Rhodococcus sp. D2-41]MDG3012103.1 DUF402 domain-containing protein [Rhodococcus sp. D2-41]MDG3013627.1 DUF402 domain-containing protein [Corynebacteriales bacterium D3-21]
MNGTEPARPAVHPPKHETFDLVAMTNTDPKGFVRPVERYDRRPWGLYMARTADHPRFDYLESWLLPELGLRATIFHFTAGHEQDQDHYLDVGEFTDGGAVWTSVDHYLDLVVRTGRDTRLLDVDELLDARVAGLLDGPVAEAAVHRAAAAIDGLAAHGHDLGRWLDSLGMPISWR